MICLFFALLIAASARAQTADAPGTPSPNPISRALQSAGDTPYLRGLAAFKAGDGATAVQEMRKAVEANGNDANAQRWLGFLLVKENQPADAIPHLERALSLIKATKAKPASKGVLAPALRPVVADTSINLGNALLLKPHRTLKDGERAITLFRSAASLLPTQTAFYNLGYACSLNNRYEPAIAAYKEAIHLGSKDEQVWRSWSGLGYALQRMGRKDAAAAAYRQATSLNPQDASLWGESGRTRTGARRGTADIRRQCPRDGA